MVSSRKNPDRLPKLTHHKASGQGDVRIDGKDVYCGPFGTAECRARYLHLGSIDFGSSDRRAQRRFHSR
jgi:hypothetical protein